MAGGAAEWPAVGRRRCKQRVHEARGACTGNDKAQHREQAERSCIESSVCMPEVAGSLAAQWARCCWRTHAGVLALQVAGQGVAGHAHARRRGRVHQAALLAPLEGRHVAVRLGPATSNTSVKGHMRCRLCRAGRECFTALQDSCGRQAW
jgi:hypothetical protein